MKRSWVLHECLERVPSNFDAMHELLKYGLRGTDLEALVAIGNRTDNGRSVDSGVVGVCISRLCLASTSVVFDQHSHCHHFLLLS